MNLFGDQRTVGADRLKMLKERRQATVNRIKTSRGCADCPPGTQWEAVSLDFDHLPGQVKEFGIGGHLGRNWQTILAEIAKCDVVCANHHRVRTQRRKQAA